MTAANKKYCKAARRADNPLVIGDTARYVSSFVTNDEFGFFAVASRMCRKVWGDRGTQSRAVTAHCTPALLNYCFDQGLQPSRNVVVSAASLGRVDLLEVAFEKGCPFTRKALHSSVRNGHLDAVVYIASKGSLISNSTANLSAAAGHLHVLRWLCNAGCKVDQNACFDAASNGHLDCLQYLRSRSCPWDKMTAFGAARFGHFRTLRWVVDNNCPLAFSVCVGACRGGHLDILIYLREKISVAFSSSLATAAAETGQIHVLAWLHENGVGWGSDTTRMAASGGHLDVLIWGLANNCFLYRGPSVSSWGASTGSTELLEWLMDNGFEFDAGVCRFAARNGHLHLLQWANHRGIQCDLSTWKIAKFKAREGVLRFLRDIQCPGSG